MHDVDREQVKSMKVDYAGVHDVGECFKRFEKRPCRGMSLFELSVALGLLSILTLLGIPIMSTWAERFESRSEIDELRFTLASARALAALRGSRSRVRIDVDSSNYFLETRGREGQWTGRGSSRSIDSPVRLYRNGSDPVTFAGDVVEFHPDGRLAGVSGGIYLEREGGEACKITVVSATGKITYYPHW